MIFNHVFELYLILCFSIVVHEIAHVVAAKIINLDIEEVHIGDELFAIRFGKVYVSLSMFSGSYVSFYSDSMNSKSKREIIIFFLSGPLANSILIVASCIFSSYENMFAGFLFFINALLVLENGIPFVNKSNDVRQMIKYLRK